jgi:hypothetical protein
MLGCRHAIQLDGLDGHQSSGITVQIHLAACNEHTHRTHMYHEPKGAATQQLNPHIALQAWVEWPQCAVAPQLDSPVLVVGIGPRDAAA